MEAVDQALRQIGPEATEAIPALTDALDDKYKEVRQEAALGLGRIGPAATKAIPRLNEALKDNDPLVRERAAEALKRITGQ